MNITSKRGVNVFINKYTIARCEFGLESGFKRFAFEHIGYVFVYVYFDNEVEVVFGVVAIKDVAPLFEIVAIAAVALARENKQAGVASCGERFKSRSDFIYELPLGEILVGALIV